MARKQRFTLIDNYSSKAAYRLRSGHSEVKTKIAKLFAEETAARGLAVSKT